MFLRAWRRAYHSISRDDITAFQLNDISRHQLAHLQSPPLAIALHHCCGSGELLHNAEAPSYHIFDTHHAHVVWAAMSPACRPAIVSELKLHEAHALLLDAFRAHICMVGVSSGRGRAP